MKPNRNQSSIPQQTFESPHQQAIITPPNPPTPEMIERAQFKDKRSNGTRSESNF